MPAHRKRDDDTARTPRQSANGWWWVLGLTLALAGGLPAADAPAPAADPANPSLISEAQQKYWIELAETSGADRLWKFYKSEFRGTVLLTQTELGASKLSAIIDKVLDQIDKQFYLKPTRTEHQFEAANCMGYKVVYESTARGASRYQVQYFIPKNERLYVLTCSCKKGTEDAVSFDNFAAAFRPPEKK